MYITQKISLLKSEWPLKMSLNNSTNPNIVGHPITKYIE